MATKKVVLSDTDKAVVQALTLISKPLAEIATLASKLPIGPAVISTKTASQSLEKLRKVGKAQKVIVSGRQTWKLPGS